MTSLRTQAYPRVEKVASVMIERGLFSALMAVVTHFDGSKTVHRAWAFAGPTVWTDGGAFKSDLIEVKQ